MNIIEPEEYRQRQDRLAGMLRANHWDAYLVTQNVDIYYLTGTMQTGFLLLPAQGEPVLYVRRSISRAKEEAVCLVEELGSLRTWGERIVKQFPQLAKRHATGFDDKHDQDVHKPSSPVIATEFDVLPVQQYNRLHKSLPNVHWEDGSRMMRELRMKKSEAELACIRRCAQVIDTALEEAVSLLHTEMSDLDLMLHIEQSIRKQGHAGMMRMRGYNQEIITGMVASGADAAVPTYFDGPAGGRGLYTANPQGPGSQANWEK